MEIWNLFIFFIAICLVNSAKFKITSQIFMDISHDGKPLGRVIFGLFGNDSPKTIENFREICLNGIDGMSYKGSTFHRIIDKFIVQGGDIVTGDGHGSLSIYGKYFEDENLEINHTGPGFLAMANRGPDTNGCQFYVTTMAAPWLNGKHTIFGKVIEGQGIIHAVEKVKTDTDDFPVKPVVITDCGDMPLEEPFIISDDPYDLMAWIRASAVPLGMSFSILGFFHWILRKLDAYT